MTRIKICGLSRREDILYVNEAKPEYCGFIINFPKSRRNVTPEQVRDLVQGLDETICPVGVFVNEPMETILSLAADGIIQAVQLHGQESEGYIRELKEKLPGIPVIRAFRIASSEDVDRARESSADYVLLDQGTGTGQTFDWNLVQNMGRPFFLAGGLGLHNLEDAIQKLDPFAVDMSSGVETDGYKDRKKIKQVMELLRFISGTYIE